MATLNLTTIFWNVWFFVQNGTHDNGDKLVKRLGQLIDEFKPDVFGLNEVLINTRDQSSAVISFLENQDYYCHFTPLSPVDDVFTVGNLLASKKKPFAIKDHILGPDTQALRRGYKNFSVKAIEADIRYDGTSVTVVVNYLSSLLPADWGTHIAHRKEYEQIISNIPNKNLIIGGDFNEAKYMLPWLRLPKDLTRKTGTLLNPTWRLNGQKRYIGFANYDNVVYRNNGRLELQKFSVLPRYPSDHAPLLAIFTLK